MNNFQLNRMKKSVLFINHSYYITWYLSRELRNLGWKADVVNSLDPEWSYLFHGEDWQFNIKRSKMEKLRFDLFLLKSIRKYDIFVFSNLLYNLFTYFPFHRLLKRFNKKTIFVNSGCMDGVLRSTFNRDRNRICEEHCGWPPHVCNDELIIQRARERNKYFDIIYAADPFMVDYNSEPNVELPTFFCVDTDLWAPDILIPTNFKLRFPNGTIKIFHSMANMENRSLKNRNVKGTKEIVEAVNRLKNEGLPVEIIFFNNINNKDLRYYIAQSDIVVDQLRYGWFGAQGREALSMGKPVVASINSPWFYRMASSLDGYDLPIVSANVDTIYSSLKELILKPEKRTSIGQKSRQFALKWLNSKNVAILIDIQWKALLEGKRLLVRDSSLKYSHHSPH